MHSESLGSHANVDSLNRAVADYATIFSVSDASLSPLIRISAIGTLHVLTSATGDAPLGWCLLGNGLSTIASARDHSSRTPNDAARLRRIQAGAAAVIDAASHHYHRDAYRAAKRYVNGAT